MAKSGDKMTDDAGFVVFAGAVLQKWLFTGHVRFQRFLYCGARELSPVESKRARAVREVFAVGECAHGDFMQDGGQQAFGIGKVPFGGLKLEGFAATDAAKGKVKLYALPAYSYAFHALPTFHKRANQAEFSRLGLCGNVHPSAICRF